MDDRRLCITLDPDWRAHLASGESECAVLNFESIEGLFQLIESWRWEVLRKAREQWVPAGALPLIAGHLQALERLGLVERDDSGQPYCHYRSIDLAEAAIDALAREVSRHPERLEGLDAMIASRLQARAHELEAAAFTGAAGSSPGARPPSPLR